MQSLINILHVGYEAVIAETMKCVVMFWGNILSLKLWCSAKLLGITTQKTVLFGFLYSYVKYIHIMLLTHKQVTKGNMNLCRNTVLENRVLTRIFGPNREKVRRTKSMEPSIT